MFKDERDFQINRPIDEVFDFLADARNETKWATQLFLRSIEMTSSGPIGQGTSFRGIYKLAGVLDFEITLYDRPSRLRLEGE